MVICKEQILSNTLYVLFSKNTQKRHEITPMKLPPILRIMDFKFISINYNLIVPDCSSWKQVLAQRLIHGH